MNARHRVRRHAAGDLRLRAENRGDSAEVDEGAVYR